MVMLHDLDRFHLVMDVIDRVPGLSSKAAHLRQQMVDMRIAPRLDARVRRGSSGRERLTWPSSRGETSESSHEVDQIGR